MPRYYHANARTDHWVQERGMNPNTVTVGVCHSSKERRVAGFEGANKAFPFPYLLFHLGLFYVFKLSAKFSIIYTTTAPGTLIAYLKTCIKINPPKRESNESAGSILPFP